MFKWNLVKAKAIMTKKMFTIEEDASIYEAMGLLIKNRISGLPVVDAKMHLVGVITEKDIMRLLFDDITNQNVTVRHSLTKEVISFSPEDSAVDICACFIKQPIRRVPIVDNGTLVGVIARRDILAIMFASKE